MLVAAVEVTHALYPPITLGVVAIARVLTRLLVALSECGWEYILGILKTRRGNVGGMIYFALHITPIET